MDTFARISIEEEVTDENAQFKELFMSKTEMEELEKWEKKKIIPSQPRNIIVKGLSKRSIRSIK